MRPFFVRNDRDQQPRKRRGCLWTAIIFAVLYLGSSFMVGVMMGDMFSTPVTKLEPNSVYHLQMQGTVVEQGIPEDPFAALLSGVPLNSTTGTVGLNDLLSNIRLAKTDDRILGIYLDGGSLGVSAASAKAIRDALLDFKTSGKWIVAYASSYGTNNYYIASVADRIYLNPTGSVSWNGLSASKMYYTRLFDKLGIEMQILKVGTYKSAVEPYFRTSMSEADRLQTKRYLDGIWGELKAGVSTARHIDVAQLDAYADEYMTLQPAEKYIEYGLVDSLVYVQEMDSILRTYAGTKDYKKLSTGKMTNVERTPSKAADKVAILYAEGQITDNGGDGIVGTDMIKTIQKIHKDDAIKAVVLRVNSPGGSADASEQIWHAVQTLKDKGLPVVVSMGDMAASGGYYISCNADYIFAEPTTLTGSIGIFGTIPNWSKLADKVGLDFDGVGTNRHSELESNMIFKGMNPAEERLMQDMIERGYDLFTRRCADGRHMTQDAIKEIGEGRVWLGMDALQIGLVDSLGNIDNAIEKAVALAGIEQYQLVEYPKVKDPIEEIFKLLDNTTDEEKLIMKVREFASKPRIMALMPEVTIQ